MNYVEKVMPICKFLSFPLAVFSLVTCLEVVPLSALASTGNNVSNQDLIDHIDHVVITATDPDATIRFYTQVMGMKLERFGEGRVAFKIGIQKINMHIRGHEINPKAHLPVPGSLDICFISKVPLDDFIAHLKEVNWPIVEGPVPRTGANGVIRSVYLRDPDLNLIEVSEYVQ